MTNHGCGIAWCTNNDAACEAQRLEHDSPSWYGSATGRAISRSGSAYNEELLTVGVGMRFNADIYPAPSIFIHLAGGPHEVDAEAFLQLNEAVLLHKAIGDFLRAALADYKLDPTKVVEDYYDPAVDE